MSTSSFPAGFLFGVAGSGHQTEGDDVTSDTAFLESLSPTIFREPAGPACRSWERWAQDLDLAAGMGLDAYRFSVEWCRVEPAPGEIDESALDRYEAIVDGCLARGMTPLVTYNHFTNPHWVARLGGFTSESVGEHFAQYCARVTRRFGNRIGYAITFNEPNLPRLLSWITLPQFVRDLERATLEGAARTAGVPRYVASNVVLPEVFGELEDGLAAAHVLATSAIKAERADLPVGLSIAIMDDIVVGDDPTARDVKRDQCYERWLGLARDDDFVGVQNYERIVFDGAGVVPPGPGTPLNQMHSAIEPDSLAGAVRYAYERAGVPVLVTEHGIAIEDDAVRAAFLPASLAGLSEVVAEGVPVLGYTHWTLLDNYEWVFGYESKLGLCEVDRVTFDRTPKPSAAVYAGLVAASRA